MSKSIKVSSRRMPQVRPKLRPQVRFEFKKPVKQELHTAQVRLAKGGSVKLVALRNPAEEWKIVPISPSTSEKQGNWACDVTRWSGKWVSREAAILNPNFHQMYPGAVYDYTSIANGDYKTLPYARKPLMVSVDGVSFSKPAVRVPNPSRAAVAQAVAAIKGSQRIQPGARTFGSRFEVLSEEDLFIRTGGSGYYLGFGGSHQFDYGSNRKSHKYFLDVVQLYYTVSVDDSVNEPGDFFVTRAEQPSNPDAVADSQLDPNWVYVESVTYGRMLQVMFESDRSFESVGLEVEAHANFLAAGAQGTLDLDQKNLLKETTVTVAAIGGDAGPSGKLLTAKFADLPGRIDEWFSASGGEVPIAYSLRTLDGALVGTHMTTEFTSRQCAPVASHYKVTWKNVICLVADDQNSRNDPEETKLFVRIRAWDGGGKDILDVDKRNKNVIAHADNPHRKEWTFTAGSGANPLVLSTGERRDMSHHSVKFAIAPGDTSATIGIRADVLEFDGALDSNDRFADEAKTYRISEVGSGKAVSLLCTHEDSRIQFTFTIEPVFED